ncbi:uncharacterized protein LOC144223912 isoform X1 [Crocuta crocuta]
MTETLPSVCPHPTHECTSKSVCLSQEIHQLKGLMEKIIYQVNTMSYFEAHGDEAEASCNFAAYADFWQFGWRRRSYVSMSREDSGSESKSAFLETLVCTSPTN